MMVYRNYVLQCRHATCNSLAVRSRKREATTEEPTHAEAMITSPSTYAGNKHRGNTQKDV
uniref:Uncharacterized protein n=1 Tax=Arundo donax TaxID=35708 RepID=A0A0A9EIC4_ARUDO